MTKTRFLIGIALAILMCASLAFATNLSYDDGENNGGQEFNPGYEYKAIKFTLSDFNLSASQRLETVKTYWRDVTGHPSTLKYKVKIYDENGTALTGWTRWIRNPTLGWNSYDLPTPIRITNDFFVVVRAPIYSGADEMDLGWDTANAGQSYVIRNRAFERVYGDRNYMINAVVTEANNPPTMTGLKDSEDPIRSNTSLEIVPKNPEDLDDDQLDIVCSYDPTPSTSSQICTNYPQLESSSYDDLACDLISDSNEDEDTIYCRLHDGFDYSSEEVVQNTDDNTPPEVDIYTGDNAGEDTIFDDDMEVHATFGTSDASEIDSCKIDWGEGDGWENVIPPSTTTSDVHTYSADGNYTVSYKCTDEVDWTNETSSNIVVDTTAPVAGVLTLDDVEFPGEPRDSDGSVRLDWTAASDANGIDYYEIYRDSSLIATVNGSTLTYLEGGLPGDNVTYEWYVKAYDMVGLSDETNTEDVRVDTVAPYVQITSPADGLFTNNDDITLIADYGNHYNVTCVAKVDGGSWEDMDGDGLVHGTANVDFNNLDDGRHTLTVSCNDGFNGSPGLTSEDSVGIFVDTVEPDVSIELRDFLTSSDFDNDGMVWSKLRNSDDRPSSGYSCEINWGDGWNSISRHTRYRGNYYPTDGIKEVEYRCTDRAGNVGTATDTILVDRVFPVSSHELSVNSCGTDWYNDDVEVTLSATDFGFDDDPQTGSGIDKIRYKIGSGSWTTYTGPITVSDEGITTIYYYARDNAGNWEYFNPGPNSVEVKIDRTLPEADIGYPVDTEHIANNNVTFSGTAVDFGAYNSTGAGVQYVEVQVEKVSDGSVVLAWTQANGADIWDYNWNGPENIEYVLKARATDNACNVESTDVVTFTLQEDYDWKYYTKEEIDYRMDSFFDIIVDIEERQNATDEELQELQDNLSEILDDINVSITDLEDRVDDIEGNITLINRRISRIIYAINGIFDDIDGLQDRVNGLSRRMGALEDRVDQLELVADELADFGMEYDQVDKTLFIDGSGAPSDAGYAKIFVKTVDGNHIDMAQVNVYPDATFEHTFDVSEWKLEGVNIYVKFYEGRELRWRGGQGWSPRYNRPLKVIVDTWDGLLAELDYGFELVDEKNWVTYYMNDAVMRDIVYSVKPHVDGKSEWRFDGGLYQISLVQTLDEGNETITQVLENCTWLDADQENVFISSVEVPMVGEYLVHLEAQKTKRCEIRNRGEHINSNRFTINLRDLKYNMPEANLEVVSPETNNGDVYWTRSDNEFLLAGRLELGDGLNSPEVPYCGVTDMTDIATPFPFHLAMVEDEGYVTCLEEVTAASMSNGALGNGDEGLYEVLLDSRVEDAIDPTDVIMIGVDDTDPVVNAIYPSEENTVSGEVLFTTNVSDALSGVETVYMSLILKSSEEVEWTHPASYNEITELWEVMVNTTLVPDGSYNISVDAGDFAGNTINLMIDPIVDNTAPVINVTYVNYVNSSLYRGHLLDMVVFVTDNYMSNLSDSEVFGIASVKVNIGSTTCDLVQVAGDNVSGAFETSGCLITEAAGTYNLSVVAEDEAKDATPNVATLDEEVTVKESIEVLSGTCTNIIGTEFDVNGSNVLFNSSCDELVNVSIVVPGGVPPETVTWELDVNESRGVFMIEHFIISAAEAEILSGYYDADKEELVFIGNGTGVQDVLIYVGSHGDAVKVSFDTGTVIAESYDDATKTITVTVEYGSPHETVISWYVAPPVTPPTEPETGGSSGGSSGGSRSVCFPNWECSEWSSCSDGTQTRTCTDTWSCESDYNMPAETQSCTVGGSSASSLRDTSADNGNSEVVEATRGPSAPPEAPSAPGEEVEARNPLGGFITANVPGILGGLVGIILLVSLVVFAVKGSNKRRTRHIN